MFFQLNYKYWIKKIKEFYDWFTKYGRSIVEKVKHFFHIYVKYSTSIDYADGVFYISNPKQ